ncbi:MAG: glycogen synthase [Acidobacteriota bacterium]
MPGALKICFAASEIAPFAKTGGLADVSAALPLAVHRQGHDVRLFMPCYAGLQTDGVTLQAVDFARDVSLRLGSRTFVFTLRTATLPGSNLAVYFIDCPELYHRGSIYTDDDDEHRRFGFFSSAVIHVCQRMGWGPDLFHSNDWHTALLPLFARSHYDWDTLFSHSRHLLTIHNIGYQGLFPAAAIDDLGLGRWAHLFDQDDLGAGCVNFLRTGLLHTDVITTVSPTYAHEIRTDAYGMGLDGLLRERRECLFGILNGVDYDEWSPQKDRFIRHRYSPGRLAGKQKNKLHLLSELNLQPNGSTPLFGMITRLTSQKGLDLCMAVLPELLTREDAMLVVLGTGEARYEEFFTRLQQRLPGRVVFYCGYNNELAHWIEAGADFFIMPSRYEPCGLNQMFSLKYGTLPLVRRTGGLADSVQSFDPRTGEGTGFVFDHYTPQGLGWALDQALALYRNPELFTKARRNAMAVDHSWNRRSKEYLELYGKLTAAAPRSG